MNAYGCQILFEGDLKNVVDQKRVKDNPRLHLVIPLLLECTIRASVVAKCSIVAAFSQNAPEDGTGSYEPIATYWLKYARKTSDRDIRAGLKQMMEKEQEEIDSSCSVCQKQDSDAVNLRSTECQKAHWHAVHGGACRHLGILKKYHRPFAENIQNDIINGIDAENIPELQELRSRLGLSRPQTDYQ